VSFGDATRPTGSRSARWALAVLTLINLINYLDRFVLSALVESLKRSELALSDAQLGFLMTGFVLVYMLASPVFAALADRGSSRPLLLAVGVAVWSLATLLSALATSYPALFLARAAVGVGEAAYGTVAPAMIADQHPPARRGRAFAVFYAAIPIGSALGYVVGGLVDHLAGWRAAFLVASVPGLLLSIAALRLSDPPRAEAWRPTAGSSATARTASPCSATPRTRSRSVGWPSGCRPSWSVSGASRGRTRRSSLEPSSW
jgi:MFS family permease